MSGQVLVTAAEAAVAVGVKATTIRSWVRRGHLAAAETAGRWPLYDLDAVYDAEQKVRGAAPSAEQVAAAYNAVGGRCIASARGGERCVRPAVESCPVPLCSEHMLQVAGYVSMRKDEIVAARLAERPPDPKAAAFEPVVYFVRSGDRVKIGTTTNFYQRMGDLQPEEVLRVLPGHFKEEKQLHAVFRADRISPAREWFLYSEAIKAFVRETQDQDVQERMAVALGGGKLTP